MGVPLKQQIGLGMYILGKKLRREKRYPCGARSAIPWC
jgi:hypothetical protein